MSQIGKVLSLYISVKDVSQPVALETIEVDPKGILKDKHYDTNVSRSVLITSETSYILAKEQNIDIPEASLGENILIDYNPYSLPVATQLQIGEAIFEITQNCTLCDHLSKIDKKLPKLLRHDRGIFSKVIRAGKVQIGDKVLLLKQ